MKLKLLLFFAATSLFIACDNENDSGGGGSDNKIEDEEIFQNKYYARNVFDCFRTPSDPVAGEEWRLYQFAAPYNSRTRDKIVWPEGGYLMFDIAEDVDNAYASSLIDDVENSGKTYKIQLKLYQANGTFVELVADYGKFGGFGEAGFFYEQEEYYGTLFANAGSEIGGELSYTPTIGYITKLSELIGYTGKPQ